MNDEDDQFETGAALAKAQAAEAAEYTATNPADIRWMARGNAKDVDIADVTIAIAGQELLNLAKLRLMHGHHYGLVGRNGIGKSTLLRRIAQGQIGGWPAHLKTALVQQEVVGSDLTAVEEILAADTERVKLLSKEKELLARGGREAEALLVDVYESLAAMDSDSVPGRAAEALDEVGLTLAQTTVPTKTLSGGWRMRVALASALYLSPDILLLDEPTNHLDLHGVVWLTDWVRSLDCTVVIVSHDAAFLRDATTDTIHFRAGQLNYFQGNFDSFLKTRSEAAANIGRQQAALDSKRAHIRASIEKMKKQAKTGGQEMKLGGVASRQKKLGRMGFEKTADGKKFNAQEHGRRQGAINDAGITEAGTNSKRVAISQIEPPDADFKFIFPAIDLGKIPEGSPLVSLKDVAFEHGMGEEEFDVVRAQARRLAESTRAALAEGQIPPTPAASRPDLLFSHLDLVVRPGDKIGLLGANGLGKSTLLQLIAGRMAPTAGTVATHDQCRVAYFAQHFVDLLDARLTPLQHIQANCPHFANHARTEPEARAVLGRFGLGGKLALAPIGTLSGGQKARLVFASLMSNEPHLLLLDEPTNHLDFISIQALMDAVSNFSGAVVLVSHDQALMACCHELWQVEKRAPTKQAKVNPNQLKAAALKAQKEIAAENKLKTKQASKSSASASKPAAAAAAAAAAAKEVLVLPSRCVLRKLNVSFDEYRESIVNGEA